MSPGLRSYRVTLHWYRTAALAGAHRTPGFQARSQDCKFGGAASVFGADIFRVLGLLYCYSMLAMPTVFSVTEYTNIVVIK